tara:strand:- start:156 stop:365 length:210 start_codon:yes stop_codon:yes gene_type:complete
VAVEVLVIMEMRLELLVDLVEEAEIMEHQELEQQVKVTLEEQVLTTPTLVVVEQEKLVTLTARVMAVMV